MHAFEEDLTDVSFTPEDRVRELSAIFAAGLLRLSSRPQVLPMATDSGMCSAPREFSQFTGNPLGFRAKSLPDPPTG
jgi:hypothetical protein